MRKMRWNFPDLRHVDWRHVVQRAKGVATEGWYVAGDEKSRNRARILTYNYTANVVANLIGGSFYTGLLILLNADDAFIGSMTMIAVAANMLQLFAPLILERFARRRTILLTMRVVLMVLNVLVIGLIPIFPVHQQLKLTLFALTVLLVNLINAFIAPGFSVWHIQSIPPNVRNHFFTLITMTVGAVVALMNLLGSAVVDAFKANGMEYTGLLVLRLFAMALVAVDTVLLFRVTEEPYQQPPVKLTFKTLLVKPFQEKLYLRTVAITFLWNFTANIPGQYYTVYLLKNVGVNYSYLMLINMLNVPIVLFFTPIWSRILSRANWFKTLYISMAFYLLHYVGLAFVTRETLWLYPIVLVYAFLMAGGINLSFTGIPYCNMPKENQTVFIGFYSTMANLAALLGVTLSRFFIGWTEGMEVSIFGFTMVNKQVLVLGTAVMMALATIGIRFIQTTTKTMEE